MHLNLTQGIGYAGKKGDRPWVAQITGTDKQFGLARDFADEESVSSDGKRGQRYYRNYQYVLGPGLYEISEHRDRHFRIIWDGGEKWRRVDATRAQAIARMLEDGVEFEDARLATKAKAEEPACKAS